MQHWRLLHAKLGLAQAPSVLVPVPSHAVFAGPATASPSAVRGTACAAVVIGIQQEKLQGRVKVNLPGGSLYIAWNGPGTPVYMTGPAEHVFDGQIEL